MCYPKPGPRCTPHAKKRLQNALHSYKEAVEKPAHPYVIEQRKIQLKDAKRAFEATPGGLKLLKAKLMNETDEDRKKLLKKRIQLAQTTRENQIKAYREMLEEKNTQGGKVYLDDIAPEKDFEEALANKYIRKQSHPDPNVPYEVYDYTEQATFDRAWSPVTMASRGLIVNKETGEIVARPFKKFFNDAEPAPGYNDFPREGKVEVYDKVDGSCGIAYRLPNGEVSIATRGSMASDQAIHATRIMKEEYPDFNPDNNTTYMFEIVYPENRIVVGYGDMDDLVLLGGVDKKTGRSVPLDDLKKNWNGPVVEKYDYTSYSEALSAPVPSGREGYVIHFTDQDKRVKLKGEEYLRLHRVITNATPRRVWELVSNGQDIEEWLRTGVPDEFADWARSEAARQNNNFQEYRNGIDREYSRAQEAMKENHPNGYSQKDFAMWVNKNVDKQDRGFMFRLEMGGADSEKRIAESIWKLIRPEHEKPVF